MPEIHLLDKETAELIAAGEVIERPASVIKELVENSIDSGASAITVEIKHGGITYMRITDNGCGISPDEISTAFLRHATSKINNKNDLENILTLGFRGEALASIAAVSRVEVLSKQAESPLGIHYCIEGSEETLSEETGCPDGTTFVIRDLFYNVPARLKFLKKDASEGNAVASIVDKIALSHPEVSIRFIRDNKQELFTPGDGELFSAIYAVFGKQFAHSLLPVDYSSGALKIKGFTVKPDFSRANRSFQHFFINGRYVKSITCTVSLEEAYKNSLMTGKFPACVLNLELPPHTVDVNVHPSKMEVKFSDEKPVFELIYFAVKNTLLSEDKPKELVFSAPKISEKKPEFSKPVFEVKREESPKSAVSVFEPTPETSQLAFESVKTEYSCKLAKNPEIKREEPVSDLVEAKPVEQKTEPEDFSGFKYINSESFVKKENPAPEPVSEPEEPQIRMAGEIFNSYILAEAGGEFFIIDKHAAHERLLFEKLKAGQTSLDSQLLLSPVKVLSTHEEKEAILENSDAVKALGFTVFSGSDNEIVVTGIPVCLDNAEVQCMILEVAEHLIQSRIDPQSDSLDELYHSMACKAAIKAHDKNDPRELKYLLEQIYGNPEIRHCPHGRPVMISMTKQELEKQFKRIV